MSFAQGEISLSVENVDLKTLLVEIEKKSDIRFTYLNQLSDTNKDISLVVTNKTVEEILNLVLSKKGMEFTRTGNTIAIQMRSPQNRQTAPTKKVTGIVTDSNGEPIIGANVSVKGTTTGTITDIDGHFSLEAIQGQTILVSFIGYSSKEIELRVDANGAFSPTDAMEKLKRLSELDLHSIEQPIRAGQWEEMARLTSESPLPIALDEELIGYNTWEEKQRLLSAIRPQYIIIKPSLHGGLAGGEEWIAEAEKLNIGWWITSALESNIGLNAIAQWCATFQNPLPQGLGTGLLFTDNVEMPLEIRKDCLWFCK